MGEEYSTRQYSIVIDYQYGQRTTERNTKNLIDFFSSPFQEQWSRLPHTYYTVIGPSGQVITFKGAQVKELRPS